MGSLYSKGLALDSLREYISGVQSEEQRLTEEEKLLLALDSLHFSETLNGFIAEYLERERRVNIPLLRSFREYLNLVKKQNKSKTE